MDRRAFIISSAAFLASGKAAMAGTVYVNSPGDGFINLRSGPGNNYTKIRKVNNGTKLTSYESVGQWVKVKTPNGTVGWAFGPHLSGSRGRYYTVVSKNNYNIALRNGPGKGYKQIAILQEGERVELIKSDGNWRKVRVLSTGKVGWLRKANLLD